MFLTTYVTTRSKPGDDNPAYAQLALPSFLTRTKLLRRDWSGSIVPQRRLTAARRKPVYSARGLRCFVGYAQHHRHVR